MVGTAEKKGKKKGGRKAETSECLTKTQTIYRVTEHEGIVQDIPGSTATNERDTMIGS